MKNSNLVVGASLKVHRYSNMAIDRLRAHGHDVKAIGLREGFVNDVTIVKGRPDYQDIDTVTLYINPRRQPDCYEYIVSLKPRRVIFNPGTENSEFERLLESKGIKAIRACTLVMLSSGQY
ncbi:MAG TPA: CoA-binding protein [Flavobacteriales bacterium]|nr:CoA-binding protein [Flavobacteriales bacterium]